MRVEKAIVAAMLANEKLVLQPGIAGRTHVHEMEIPVKEEPPEEEERAMSPAGERVWTVSSLTQTLEASSADGGSKQSAPPSPSVASLAVKRLSVTVRPPPRTKRTAPHASATFERSVVFSITSCLPSRNESNSTAPPSAAVLPSNRLERMDRLTLPVARTAPPDAPAPALLRRKADPATATLEVEQKGCAAHHGGTTLLSAWIITAPPPEVTVLESETSESTIAANVCQTETAPPERPEEQLEKRERTTVRFWTNCPATAPPVSSEELQLSKVESAMRTVAPRWPLIAPPSMTEDTPLKLHAETESVESRPTEIPPA